MRLSYLFSTIFILVVSMNLYAQSSQKILVAYYSHSGNTKVVAEQIQNATEADIFEIVPVVAYPTDYQTVVDQAKEEINKNYHPALKSKIENIDQYDVIFVGSPNWWSTVAPPVATFLAENDLSGKTIVPFITHEGSRMGRSEDDIKKLCPNSTVLKGLPIRGGSVKNAQADVNKWLKEIGVLN